MRTSPHYPQSNGKVERFHGTIKKECIRKKALLDQDHAKIIIGSYDEIKLNKLEYKLTSQKLYSYQL